MSTVFAICKLEIVPDEQFSGMDEEEIASEIGEEGFIEVARRGNGTGFTWLNELARYLPSDLKVYPLDNSSQGIYTIGDILKEMGLTYFNQYTELYTVLYNDPYGPFPMPLTRCCGLGPITNENFCPGCGLQIKR
jgi:hypothetical protein